ncbi:MAG: CBS domain-containing protein [Rhodoferax sp.]|nr:CBS domain-containing protein [Rhodoferax sp.]
MRRHPTGLTFDDTVADAVKLKSDHQVRCFPVVDRNKRLVGVVALGGFAVENSQIQSAAEGLSIISEQSRGDAPF